MPNAFKPDTNFPGIGRSDFIICIDGNTIRRLVGQEEVGEGYAWARVDKSEQFEFQTNPNTEDKNYIDSENTQTNIIGYNLTMPQEILIDNNNEVYSLMNEYMFAFPKGSDAQVPATIIYPSPVEPGVYKAKMWPNALLVTGTLNGPEKILTFDINFNGDHESGTGAKSTATGRFEFTPLPAGGNTEESGGAPSGQSDTPSVLSSKSTLSK